MSVKECTQTNGQVNESRLLIKVQNATIISRGEIVNIELLGDRG